MAIIYLIFCSKSLIQFDLGCRGIRFVAIKICLSRAAQADSRWAEKEPTLKKDSLSKLTKGQNIHVELFYNPDKGQGQRLAKKGNGCLSLLTPSIFCRPPLAYFYRSNPPPPPLVHTYLSLSVWL